MYEPIPQNQTTNPNDEDDDDEDDDDDDEFSSGDEIDPDAHFEMFASSRVFEANNKPKTNQKPECYNNNKPTQRLIIYIFVFIVGCLFI